MINALTPSIAVDSRSTGLLRRQHSTLTIHWSTPPIARQTCHPLVYPCREHRRLTIHRSTPSTAQQARDPLVYPADSTADSQATGLTTINSIVHSPCTGHRYMDGRTAMVFTKRVYFFLIRTKHLITQAVQTVTRIAYFATAYKTYTCTRITILTAATF